ncbi:MAG: NAD(P)H-hydrate dehydratase [Clostridia bacterium]|nr:NAD(P)H-hydrate dehydratase [Clostridia bacterium]
MYIVNSSQMKKIEEKAADAGIKTLILMENAASALKAGVLCFKPEKTFVFTGKGQNAGDGFALSRQMMLSGYDVSVVTVCDPELLTGDAKINFEIAKNIGVDIKPFDKNADYSCDVLVECICGTGFRGELSGGFLDAADVINSVKAHIICADIPLGVCADSGETDKNAVKAEKTVTFGYPKLGLYSPLSADFVGEVVTGDISVNGKDAEDTGVKTFLTSIKDVYIPKKSKGANKGTNGRVLIAGGSVGMAGAVIMAANAAQKCGAGTVTCAAPKEISSPLMSQLLGAMYTDIETVDFSKYDAVLFGNGAGKSDKTRKLLEKAVKTCLGTLIIDADGLNVLSEDISILKESKAEIILTPHPLEFSRISGTDVPEILKNRIDKAIDFSVKTNAVTVLKTAYTVVADENGYAYINTTGNEGMAKGGSGDILAGMMAGLAPSFTNKTDMAKCAVFLHGLAGDKAAEKHGKLSMTPEDILSEIAGGVLEIEKNMF